jgi:hypothetical protein
MKLFKKICTIVMVFSMIALVQMKVIAVNYDSILEPNDRAALQQIRQENISKRFIGTKLDELVKFIFRANSEGEEVSEEVKLKRAAACGLLVCNKGRKICITQRYSKKILDIVNLV